MPAATAIRLLLLAALCSLAACQQYLRPIMEPSNFLVKLDESSDELGPRYLLKKQYIITVTCSMRDSNNSVLQDPSIVWHMTGSKGTTLPEFRFHSAGSLSEDGTNYTSVLTLRRAINEDIANYTCTGKIGGLALTSTAIAQIQSRPLVVAKVGGVKTFDHSIWPGDDLSIECAAEGNPTGSVGWFKKTTCAEVSLHNGSLLNLTNLSYELDRGFITCRSRNRFGENSAQVYLRVKNPQAYLPPLLIIIAEVVVIAAVVAGYEQYMRKKRRQWNSDGGAANKAD